MKEIRVIRVDEAELQAALIAQRVLDFLTDFNATYPDLDAANITAEFHYFTPSYVARACASALSEKYVIRLAELRMPADSRPLSEAMKERIRKRIRERKQGANAGQTRARKKSKAANKDKNDLGVT